MVESLKPIDKEVLTAGLSANSIIRTLSYHQKLDSTNAFASSLVQSKSFDNGTVIVADEQTAGRGRRGKSWFSPKYSNVYASIILKDEMQANQSFFMTLTAAVCVKHALEKHCGMTAGLKWPNDVLIGRKKIAGILIERLEGHFIVGLGLNVNMDPNQSLELRLKATSVLKETGLWMDREGLILGILSCFEKCYGTCCANKQDIFAEWRDSLIWPKRPVEMMIDSKKVLAKPLRVAEDGGLILLVCGKERTVYNAEYV